MSVSVTGSPALLYYSSEARPSRISTGFAEIVRRTATSLNGGDIPLTLTVNTPRGRFAGVIYFVVDPLCQADVVIGNDWLDLCMSHGCSPGVKDLPVYRHGESLSFLSCIFHHTSSTDLSLLPLPEYSTFGSG